MRRQGAKVRSLPASATSALETKCRRSLAGKAALLAERDRIAEAIATLTQLIDTFATDDTPLIQQVVANARKARDQLLEDRED